MKTKSINTFYKELILFLKRKQYSLKFENDNFVIFTLGHEVFFDGHYFLYKRGINLQLELLEKTFSFRRQFKEWPSSYYYAKSKTHF